MKSQQHQQDSRSRNEREPGAKRVWATPQLVTLDAADAEAGANPINDEGIFAQGS